MTSNKHTSPEMGSRPSPSSTALEGLGLLPIPPIMGTATVQVVVPHLTFPTRKDKQEVLKSILKALSKKGLKDGFLASREGSQRFRLGFFTQVDKKRMKLTLKETLGRCKTPKFSIQYHSPVSYLNGRADRRLHRQLVIRSQSSDPTTRRKASAYQRNLFAEKMVCSNKKLAPLYRKQELQFKTIFDRYERRDWLLFRLNPKRSLSEDKLIQPRKFEKFRVEITNQPLDFLNMGNVNYPDEPDIFSCLRYGDAYFLGVANWLYHKGASLAVIRSDKKNFKARCILLETVNGYLVRSKIYGLNSADRKELRACLDSLGVLKKPDEYEIYRAKGEFSTYYTLPYMDYPLRIDGVEVIFG